MRAVEACRSRGTTIRVGSCNRGIDDSWILFVKFEVDFNTAQAFPVTQNLPAAAR